MKGGAQRPPKPSGTCSSSIERHPIEIRCCRGGGRVRRPPPFRTRPFHRTQPPARYVGSILASWADRYALEPATESDLPFLVSHGNLKLMYSAH
jgi:hypothetical protein